MKGNEIMLEAYSTNVTVTADTAIPFQNVSLKKGCTAELSGTSTIELNKCGVYMVAVSASSATSVMIQLLKNGVAQPQAQSTGTSPCFVTLVQVSENNSCCPCTAPVSLQIISDTATTFVNANVAVTKIV